jgi:cob(I)alamin adenosyltransferase
MVRLNRIYTRTGDDGTTGLGDGSRLPKHHLRVAAYGTVDELSSVLGLARAQGLKEPLEGWILAIQNDLFDVGADLCVPGAGGDKLRIGADYTARLERWLDQANERLAPLSTFVLPGGHAAAAWMHLARTVCRRAERLVTELAALPGERERLNAEIVKYLNRLSDLCFVLARVANDDGAADVLWEPGKGRSDGASKPTK